MLPGLGSPAGKANAPAVNVANLVFNSYGENASDLTTYTASFSVLTNGVQNLVLLFHAASTVGTRTISSISIGGVSGVQRGFYPSGSFAPVGVWACYTFANVNVAAGAVTLTVTFSGGMTGVFGTLYTLTGSSLIPVASAGGSSGTGSADYANSVSSQPGDVFVWFTRKVSPFTWTPIFDGETVIVDQSILSTDGGTVGVASYRVNGAVTNGGSALGITWSGSSAGGQIFAQFRV